MAAENEIEIDAPPERVWEVLANPESFDDWVVGAKDVRDADDDAGPRSARSCITAAASAR